MPMNDGRIILDSKPFGMVLDRLCCELIENYDRFEEACLIGIQPRGTFLADRLYARLDDWNARGELQYGKLDITFYRDDFHLREAPLIASETELDFPVEGRHIILVDDVLYTGRTVHAAMTALGDFGRPATVALLTLVDRRFNRHLPIRADHVGIRVDAVDEAYVRVRWRDHDGEDQVLIFGQKEKRQA